MTIQTIIATKREILNDATQARVDATHREIRAESPRVWWRV